MTILKYLRESDRLFAIALMVFAVTMYLLAGGLAEAYGPGAIAASTYPRLVLLCMMFICAIIILKPARAEKIQTAWTWKGVPVILLTVVYIALIEPVGFFIITPVYLFLLPWLAGFRQYVRLIINVVVITACLYGVFVEILDIPLPPGLLGE